MDIVMDTPKILILPEHLNLIAEIDEFKGKWISLRRMEPDRLQSLKKIASIESIGSSTRIEGARLNDREVEELLSGLHLTSFKSRDEEEVAGYAEVMQLVFDSHEHIPITENHIKQLHRDLLKYSSKDARHRGEYKSLPNHVEAFDADGESLGIIFETASPFDTPRKMKQLVLWLNRAREDGELHGVLITAIFVVHFLAIHPFQDGNGRLSRILTTLLLLQGGYEYVQYSSLERIVEENKDHYYLSLRRAQQTIASDNSTLRNWITFFLRSLREQVAVLESRLRYEDAVTEIPPLSKEILKIARERGRVTIREAEVLTGANRNTIKKHIQNLVRRGFLEQKGVGKGTWYR
jgi:Fic family protein